MQTLPHLCAVAVEDLGLAYFTGVTCLFIGDIHCYKCVCLYFICQVGTGSIP